MREFQDFEAERSELPLLLGLVGPSGSGKTYSALRLASGIQRVSGGDIFFVDTEANRAKHYADKFKFRHVPFVKPFSPLDYLGAIEHCVKNGARTVIIDSMSHEHNGEGGVLESHEKELDRLAGDNYDKRNKMKFLAWQKPKGARLKLINAILQMDVRLIACFRAKEKTKPTKGGGILELGWQPIAGEDFIFEMMANFLLLPQSGGVPCWQPPHDGEKQMIKLPGQFADLFREAKPLSEDHGETMAKWAKGETIIEAPAPQVKEPKTSKAVDTTQSLFLQLAEALRFSFNITQLKVTWAEVTKAHNSNGISDEELAELTSIKDELKKTIGGK